MHLYQGPVAFLAILPAAVILSSSYLASCRLWPAIVAHVIADLALDAPRRVVSGDRGGGRPYTRAMNRSFSRIAGRVLVAAMVAGPASSFADPSTSAHDAAVKSLTAQADAWDKAIVRKDRAAIEGNMAEDFRQIDRAGNVETKKSFVDGLMSADLVIDPYTVEDFDVRLYGDVALLCGRTRMTGKYEGKPFTSHYRYIDIYVRKGNAWKIVSVQISPMAAAPTAQ